MNQVIDEVKRSAYDVNATIVSSRVSLCLNDNVNPRKAQKSNVNLLQKCLETQRVQSCPFLIDQKKMSSTSFKQALNIEDLQNFGERSSVCSYYHAKRFSEICDVVVLSYNYIVDSIYRQSIKEYLENSFIVFDEAHNLTRVLEEACSWEMDVNDLERISQDFRVVQEVV